MNRRFFACIICGSTAILEADNYVSANLGCCCANNIRIIMVELETEDTMNKIADKAYKKRRLKTLKDELVTINNEIIELEREIKL